MSPRELLSQLIARSSGEALLSFLEHPQTDEALVLALLRRRELATSLIESVARHERWNRRLSVRAAIVHHTKTPQTLSLRLLSLLYWKEQLRVTRNVRLAMPLRVAAENRLRERLPELELGEKVALARQAPVSLLPLLGEEADSRVIHSLVQNPRLREPDVMAIVRRESTPGPVLRVVASAERWVNRPAILMALVSHRNTPVHVALSLLKRLPRTRLGRLVAGGELPRVVRVKAERMLSSDEQ